MQMQKTNFTEEASRYPASSYAAPYPTQPTPSKKQSNVPERVESANKVSVIDRAKNLLNKFFD